MIIVFFIIAIVTLPLSFFAASSAVRRIKALIMQMRRVVRGDFNIAVIPSSRDEIGELIKSYSYMLGTLSATIEEKYQVGKERWRVFGLMRQRFSLRTRNRKTMLARQ